MIIFCNMINLKFSNLKDFKIKNKVLGRKLSYDQWYLRSQACCKSIISSKIRSEISDLRSQIPNLIIITDQKIQITDLITHARGIDCAWYYERSKRSMSFRKTWSNNLHVNYYERLPGLLLVRTYLLTYVIEPWYNHTRTKDRALVVLARVRR